MKSQRESHTRLNAMQHLTKKNQSGFERCHHLIVPANVIFQSGFQFHAVGFGFNSGDFQKDGKLQRNSILTVR